MIADEGYALPTSVQVSINGKIVESGYSYTDGVITISGNAVVGNITITASGTPERFMVTLNLNDARLSHGSTNASVSLEGVQVNENGEIELWAVYDGNYSTLYTTEDGNTSVSLADFTSENVTRTGYNFNARWFMTDLYADASTATAQEVTANTTFATANDLTTIYAYWTTKIITLTLTETEGNSKRSGIHHRVQLHTSKCNSRRTHLRWLDNKRKCWRTC